METELTVFDNSERIVISITELIDNEAIEKLRTKLEMGHTPTWAREETNIQERQKIAQKSSGGAHFSITSKNIESLPKTYKNPVKTIESGNAQLQNVTEFKVDKQNRDARLTFSGTINSNGELMRSPNVRLIYENGYNIKIVETVPTTENGNQVGHDELKLSHNEVVTKINESTNWISKADKRHAENFNPEIHTDFVDYLFAVYIEGHITDGWFENDFPPFDYTKMLEKEQEVGRLMYYAYRYNGWEYSKEDLKRDVEKLNERYSDGGWLIV
jgi:hypothetical protein